MANEYYKAFLGDQPYQGYVKNQRFGDWLCFHHQDRPWFLTQQ
jgi:hypothetical protein